MDHFLRELLHDRRNIPLKVSDADHHQEFHSGRRLARQGQFISTQPQGRVGGNTVQGTINEFDNLRVLPVSIGIFGPAPGDGAQIAFKVLDKVWHDYSFLTPLPSHRTQGILTLTPNESGRPAPRPRRGGCFIGQQPTGAHPHERHKTIRGLSQSFSSHSGNEPHQPLQTGKITAVSGASCSASSASGCAAGTGTQMAEHSEPNEDVPAKQGPHRRVTIPWIGSVRGKSHHSKKRYLRQSSDIIPKPYLEEEQLARTGQAPQMAWSSTPGGRKSLSAGTNAVGWTGPAL